jgi:glycosyltransferase involved in cell wall biosynthesis
MPQVKTNQFPLVSICIANYNKAPYIKQCLDSILSVETYPNREIIIVDDCSTDDSISIIKDWIQAH